ncbi:MAG: chitobiase/beta-hexosaminidase C-terminal domain-containing protein [Lachnospiraceae bacterium]|nr:chitobiase/beta-hexosaminidase C-terminal domain-containing protein [Lachnospiraceae bacterium]
MPDYSTVGDLLNSRESSLKDQEENRKSGKKKRKARLEKRMNPVAWTIVLIFGMIVFALALKLAIDYRNQGDYDLQLELAEYNFSEKEYARAEAYANQAVALEPNLSEPRLLLAKIYSAQNRDEETKLVLLNLIAQDPGNADAYGLLIELYSENNDMAAIKQLMDNCSAEAVLLTYSEYICKSPLISPVEGTYERIVSITITAPEGTVHYTTDGTEPSGTSPVYEGPIGTLPGENEIRAIAIKDNGIYSDTVVKKYTITTKQHAAPSLDPGSGTYPPGTEVTVDVPFGYTAHYEFDHIPTLESAEYIDPVMLPEGTHVLTVILADSEGNLSKAASATYTVN